MGGETEKTKITIITNPFFNQDLK